MPTRPATKLRILHLEDSEEDSEAVHRFLVRDGTDIPHRETREEFIEHLRRRNFDLISADYALSSFARFHALELAREHAPDIPFVFVSGAAARNAAFGSVLNGTVDHAIDRRLSGLVSNACSSVEESESRRRHQEMERRLREAQNLEAVGTLAGGIAHDFNNILTIIKGHASLLERDCDRPERISKVATIIEHAARRGSDLVKEMLTFARKSEGIFSLCDFNKLVGDAVDMLRGSIPRDIRLEFAFDESLPALRVDAGQIERVILNLIGNARDAMPRGGRIVVSTGRIKDSSTVPCLTELPRRDYAYLQISDTGEGMDEKTRGRIFEPFFTTKPKGKGTGLGMPVVYGVMQMHHGAIHIISTPGKGTSVELYFPLILEPDLPGTCEPAAPKARGGTETLLVVDDEPDVLSFLQAMLEAEGYRVLTAGNGDEALSVFREHREEIKLLFSDLGLPNLNGYELSEQLRKLKPDLRALLGSGYADGEIKRRLEANTYTGFLAKPYAPASVLAAIRTALDEACLKTPRPKSALKRA